MAFNEGLKQKIDLLGALEARRRMEQASANDDMQRRLMQEQLKAAEWQNLKDREVPTMTVPSSGLTGMPTKKFLHEMPGYISGVDPTEVFRQWNQNFRQGMAGGGGGGGGRELTADEQRQQAAVADITEEKARQEQYQRQGYGSATADLLGKQLADAKVQGVYDRRYDDMIGDLQKNSRDRWGDIKVGDAMIKNTKQAARETGAEIDRTNKGEAKAAYESFKNNVLSGGRYKELGTDKKLKVISELPKFYTMIKSGNIKITPEVLKDFFDSVNE